MRPAFTILAYSTFEEEQDWIRRGSHCYVIRPGEEKPLTALTGVHQGPYEQGPLQFLLVDDRLLLLQDDKHIDEAKVIQEKGWIEAVTNAFDELAGRLGASQSA